MNCRMARTHKKIILFITIQLVYFPCYAQNENTSLGKDVLILNQEGYRNIAVGDYALHDNTSGFGNVSVGYGSLYANKSGIHNLGLGHSPLRYNISGSYNVALGADALSKNITGHHNVAINYDALHQNINGTDNVAIGYMSLYYNNGNGNIAIGYKSGGGHPGCGSPSHTCAEHNEKFANRSGEYNVWIGNEAGPNTTSQLTNSIAIGYKAHNTKSNEIILGNNKTESTVLFGSVFAGKSVDTNVLRVKEVDSIPEPIAGVAQLHYDKKGKSLSVVLGNGEVHALAFIKK